MIVKFDTLKVKRLMNSLKISNSQLIKALAMSQNGFYKMMESGNTHEEKVKRMAEIFGMNFTDLLHRTQKSLYGIVKEPEQEYTPQPKYIEQRIELLEKTVKSLENAIRTATDQLNRLAQTATVKHNEFVWFYFNRLIDCLVEITNICKELHEARSNGAEAVGCMLLIGQLTNLKSELHAYPTKLQTDIEIKVYRSVLKIA